MESVILVMAIEYYDAVLSTEDSQCRVRRMLCDDLRSRLLPSVFQLSIALSDCGARTGVVGICDQWERITS
jgi:hypothetical protein